MKRKTLSRKLPGPWLFAHRGYSRLAPENTLAAFDLARKEGIPGVELDVRLCATGEMLVFHDDNLKRICGVEKTVEELPLTRIRELDAGSWKDPSFRGEKIPLLSEVFELLGSGMIYDIEIKNKGKTTGPLENTLQELIRKFGLKDKCLITSFNPLCVRTFRKLEPEIPTAVIYSRDREVPWYLRRGEGRFISGCTLLKPDRKLVNGTYMFLHGKLEGYRILPWTVDDPEEGARLMKAGVSGLISNDPSPLKPLFGL